MLCSHIFYWHAFIINFSYHTLHKRHSLYSSAEVHGRSTDRVPEKRVAAARGKSSECVRVYRGGGADTRSLVVAEAGWAAGL